VLIIKFCCFFKTYTVGIKDIRAPPHSAQWFSICTYLIETAVVFIMPNGSETERAICQFLKYLESFVISHVNSVLITSFLRSSSCWTECSSRWSRLWTSCLHLTGSLHFFKDSLQLHSVMCRKTTLRSFQTSHYKMNLYETPTGLKFILNTDKNAPAVQELLRQLYSDVLFLYKYIIAQRLLFINHPRFTCRT